ncbi:MAG: hypothetical protein AAF990_19020 [Bacteroidota bacterium]
MHEILARLREKILYTFQERTGEEIPLTAWKNHKFIELSKDIERYLEAHLSADQQRAIGTQLSVSTLKRFFGEQFDLNPPIDPRRKVTLDKLCIYAGYEDYNRFVAAAKAFAPAADSRSSSLRRVALPTFILFFGMLVYVLFTQRIFSKSMASSEAFRADSLEIVEVVSRSLAAEMNAYRAIPNYQPYLDTIRQLYEENSPAYSKIEEVLKGQSAYNWRLTNFSNPSECSLLRLEVDSLFERVAYVSTKEYWNIRWFNDAAHRYEYIYEVLNNQLYILKKDPIQNRWKISVNEYPGDGHKHPQINLGCSRVQEKLGSLEKVKEEVNIAANNGGATLALKILECYFEKQGKTDDRLTALSIQLVDTYRDHNTNRIDFETFTKRKQEILLKTIQLAREF